MPNCVGESFSPWQTAQINKRCRSQFVLIAFNLKFYIWPWHLGGGVLGSTAKKKPLQRAASFEGGDPYMVHPQLVVTIPMMPPP